MISQKLKGWGALKPGPWGRIDRANPIAPKTLCLLFTEGAGTKCVNHASKANPGTTAGTATRHAGRGAKALEFNTTGSTGKITFTAASWGTTLWIGGWIYPMSGGASYGLLWGDHGGTAGLYYRNASQKLDMVFTPGGDHLSNTAIPFNAWSHVAVSITGGSGTFYLNGVPDGTFASWPGTSFDRMGVDDFTDNYRGRMESWIGTNGERITPGVARRLYVGKYEFMLAEPPGGPFVAAPPTYPGSGAVTISNLSVAGAGSYTEPVFAGDGAAIIGNLGVAGLGTYTEPVFTGDGALAISPLSVAGVGIYTAPPLPTDLLDSIESFWASTSALTALTSGFRLNVTPPGDPLPWIRAENISESLPGMSLEDEPEDVMFSITTTDLATTKRYGAILKYYMDSGPESKGPPRNNLQWLDPITGLHGYERLNVRFNSKPYRIHGLGPGGMPLWRYDIVYRFWCDRTGALP